MRRRLHLLATGTGAIALVGLTACGGSSEAANDAGDVASLVDTGDGGSEATGEPEPEVSADEAALEFSECLREEGLDVPDIGVDDEGNLQLREVLQNAEPQDSSFPEAMDACREILDGVGFGARGGGARDDAAIADAFLEFSECVRDLGFEDVPDLTAAAPGGFPRPGDGGNENTDGEDGAPPAGGAGRGEGGFGDRGTLLAEQLELDPEDPAVIEAMETCTPIIDQARNPAGVDPAAGE